MDQTPNPSTLRQPTSITAVSESTTMLTLPVACLNQREMTMLTGLEITAYLKIESSGALTCLEIESSGTLTCLELNLLA